MTRAALNLAAQSVAILLLILAASIVASLVELAICGGKL